MEPKYLAFWRWLGPPWARIHKLIYFPIIIKILVRPNKAFSETNNGISSRMSEFLEGSHPFCCWIWVGYLRYLLKAHIRNHHWDSQSAFGWLNKDPCNGLLSSLDNMGIISSPTNNPYYINRIFFWLLTQKSPTKAYQLLHMGERGCKLLGGNKW